MKKKVIDFSTITKAPFRAIQRFFAPGTHGKIRFRSFMALIVAILLAIYVFPVAWNKGADFANSKTSLKLGKLRETSFSFGLDLLGGTHLVYEADTKKIPFKDQASAVDGVRDVIERRVNSLGVSEPLVQTNYSSGRWRVIVELAGVKDVGEAIKQIGETPTLQFKTQNVTPNRSLTETEKKDMNEFNKKAKKNADDILSKALKGEDFGQLAFKYSEDKGSQEKKGDLDWFREKVMVKEFEDAVKLLKNNQIRKSLLKTQFGYHIIKRTGERTIKEEEKNIKEYRVSHILIAIKSEASYMTADDYWVDAKLSGKHLERSSVQFDPNTNMPEVGLQFNVEGKKLFKEITEKNVGKVVGIFLDGKAITTPRVNGVIYDGNARITGDFDLKEARTLAQRLNAGALPVPIKLVSQQTVGATLGKISVNKSLWAGLIGFALVCLFMILYYRFAGLMSVIALLIYGVMILAIFKFVPVTLTLAGIAGFILSVGMAVDANVLIFERLKEELEEGKDLEFSINEAFRRAWPSIRDGNISTLITAGILFWFSTSLIRGFALTLSLGIVASMFTAMVISKIFMRTAGTVIKNNWLMGK